MSQFIKRAFFGINPHFYVRSIVLGGVLSFFFLWMVESSLSDVEFATRLHSVFIFRVKVYAGIALITLLYPYSRYVQHKLGTPSACDSYSSGVEETNAFWFGADLLQACILLIYRALFWAAAPLVAPIGMIMIHCENRQARYSFA